MLLEIITIKQKKYKRKYYVIECDNCKIINQYRATVSGIKNRKYCSMKCKCDHQRIILIGENNPFYGKSHSEKTKNKLRNQINFIEKLKIENPEKYKLYCENIKLKNTGKNNPFYGKSHSEKSKNKMSETRANKILSGDIVLNGPRGKKGYYTSIKSNEVFYFESFYELLRMKMLDLDENIVSWTKKHNIKIPYRKNEEQKFYIPDFLIKTKYNQIIVEEVKGYENSEKLLLKLNSLNEYCKKMNYLVNFINREKMEILCKEKYNKSIAQLRKEFYL